MPHQRGCVAVGGDRPQRAPPASALEHVEGQPEQHERGADYEHTGGEHPDIAHIPDGVERPRDVDRIGNSRCPQRRAAG